MTRRKGMGKMTDAGTNQVTENCKTLKELKNWRNGGSSA